MTDKVIKELPDIFIDNICTMKKLRQILRTKKL